jgi:hypothetical protein
MTSVAINARPRGAPGTISAHWYLSLSLSLSLSLFGLRGEWEVGEGEPDVSFAEYLHGRPTRIRPLRAHARV